MIASLGEVLSVLSKVADIVSNFVNKPSRLGVKINIRDLVGNTPDGDEMLIARPMKVSVDNPLDKDVEVDSYWIEWGKSKWFTYNWKKETCPSFNESGDEIDMSKFVYLAKARRRIFFETEVCGLEYWLSGKTNDIKPLGKIWARIAVLDIHNNWHRSTKFELKIHPRTWYR